MNRRDLLKYTLCAAALAGGRTGLAQVGGGVPFGRTLINVMFLGGADLRYLFVPNPVTDSEYAAAFWDARSPIYQYNAANAALYPDYLSVFDPDTPGSGLYAPVSDTLSGLSFGIHRSAGWLQAQFDAGNVAIIANVVGSDNRRHDHSQLIVNTGDPTASQYVYDREGWGGRLVYSIADANAVAVTNDISVFCNGLDASYRNARVVHAKDTRDFGLSPGDGDPVSDNSAMARALRSYYAEKRNELSFRPADWPYRRFLQHEAGLRDFGDALLARLDAVAPQQPASLAALHTAGSGNTLNDDRFGLQCANVYDSFLAADLFSQRVVSMEYTGWDTHNNQKPRFESNIADVFGTGRGLATLTSELDLLGIGANEDIVYTFNTDFGRQLRANGDYGTDHGTGNYLVVIGRSVRGGVYGEMFPASEVQGGVGGTRFDQQGADIEGRTSFERVLSLVCNWVEPGTGGQVFPGAAASAIEPGVDLSGLLAG